MRQLDQKAAIMIAIEHCGDILPGQKCSAIFLDHHDIQKEKAFYERFCSGNGMQDPLQIRLMVSANVPSNPYWLVSFKPESSASKEVRFYRVDDRTGQVI